MTYGLVQCSLDRGLFFWKVDGIVQGIICIYVDDLLFGGIDSFMNSSIEQLGKEFTIGKRESVSFSYCGASIVSTSDSVSISQSEYVDSIKEISVDSLDKFRTVVGNLMWTSVNTRPDICYAVNYLSSIQLDPTKEHIRILNKTVREAKWHRSVTIQYKSPSSLENSRFLLFCDASLGNEEDSLSQGAMLLFHGTFDQTKGSWSVNLIDWFSRRIRRVATSSLSAEMMAMSSALDHCIYVREMWHEYCGEKLSVSVFSDSKSLVQLASTENNSVSEKRLIRELASIRDTNFDFRHIEAEYNIADCLTKFKCYRTKNLLREVLRTNIIDFIPAIS